MQSVASALIQEVETDFTRVAAAAVGALPSERDKADRIYCDECLNRLGHTLGMIQAFIRCMFHKKDDGVELQ